METQLTIPKVGDKVVLLRPYWHDLGDDIPAGATGVVSDVNIHQSIYIPPEDLYVVEYSIVVKLDAPVKELELDDNCISYYPEWGAEEDDDGKALSVLEWFNRDVKIVS